jgi:hypothetical protein
LRCFVTAVKKKDDKCESSAVLEKLVVAQLVNKFPMFCGTAGIIPVSPKKVLFHWSNKNTILEIVCDLVKCSGKPVK